MNLSFSIINSLLNERISELIAKVKDNKWEEIKFLRNKQEQSGLPFKGSILDYDIISVTRLTQARDGLKEAIDIGAIKEEDAKIDWTMQDNSVMTLSYSDLKSIPLLASNYSNSLHVKARELRTLIENASTVEEIYNINW